MSDKKTTNLNHQLRVRAQEARVKLSNMGINYAVSIKNKYPEFTSMDMTRKLYNVARGVTVDQRITEIMEEMVKTYAEVA